MPVARSLPVTSDPSSKTDFLRARKGTDIHSDEYGGPFPSIIELVEATFLLSSHPGFILDPNDML